MFRIFFIGLTISLLACSKGPKSQPETKQVDNAATHYAEELRSNKTNAQDAAEAMNKAINDSQKRYEEFDAQ